MIVKLSPNVTSIPHVARAAEDAGADAISLVNTFVAMAIDAETRKPRISNITAGLSGPAIKPIALRMVYEAAKTVKIPVIGIGGISTAEDVIEFMLAGATRHRGRHGQLLGSLRLRDAGRFAGEVVPGAPH